MGLVLSQLIVRDSNFVLLLENAFEFKTQVQECNKMCNLMSFGNLGVP